MTGISKEGVDEFDAEGFQPVKHGVKDTVINNSEEDTVSVSWNSRKLMNKSSRLTNRMSLGDYRCILLAS